jgi:hypothetical protein
MRLAGLIGVADDFLPALLCLWLLGAAGGATVAEVAGMVMPGMLAWSMPGIDPMSIVLELLEEAGALCA